VKRTSASFKPCERSTACPSKSLSAAWTLIAAGYFAGLMDRMEAGPRIGTCSGKPYFFPQGLNDAEVRFPLPTSLA